MRALTHSTNTPHHMSRAHTGARAVGCHSPPARRTLPLTSPSTISREARTLSLRFARTTTEPTSPTTSHHIIHHGQIVSTLKFCNLLRINVIFYYRCCSYRKC